MDGFEFNKIAGGVLASALAAAVIANIGNALVHPKMLATPAYPIEVQDAPAATPAAAAPQVPLPELLASANIDAGAQAAKKCQTCHTFTKGGANGVGPNLFGVLGGPHAHAQGFAYSSAMSADHSKVWTWDELNAWIDDPKKAIPGNKMAFAGIKNAKERADLLVWINKQSDKPLELPPK